MICKIQHDTNDVLPSDLREDVESCWKRRRVVRDENK